MSVGLKYNGISITRRNLKNVSLSQSVHLLSAEIPIDTCSFVLSQNDIEYSFQEKQPVEVFFDNKLQGMFFVKTAKRINKNDYNISCEDYKGYLETFDFKGGLYENVYAGELLKQIFAVANVPVNIDSELNAERISGYIPYTTCRKALQQILFAIQGVCITAYSKKVEIVKLKDIVSQEISKERIMQGVSVDEQSQISAVKVIAHSYIKMGEEIDIYDATESGTGDNIKIIFSEPLHSLEITNGTILDYNENYVVFNAETGCLLKGKKIKHSKYEKTKKNPQSLYSSVITIQDATLVNANNVDNILEKCYNYFTNNKSTNLKIVEGKHENHNELSIYGKTIYGENYYGLSKNIYYDEPVKIGDKISIDTDYTGSITGVVEKQSYSLNGGIIIKNTVMR